jgi:hypothetical protein
MTHAAIQSQKRDAKAHYAQLLKEFVPVAIESEAENERALKVIAGLMDIEKLSTAQNLAEVAGCACGKLRTAPLFARGAGASRSDERSDALQLEGVVSEKRRRRNWARCFSFRPACSSEARYLVEVAF